MQGATTQEREALASYKAGLVKPCLARVRGFHGQPLGRDDRGDAAPLSEACDAKSDVRKSKALPLAAELTQFDGDSTPVDLLVIYPAKVRLSDLLPAEFPAISTFWSLRKSKGHSWPQARREAQNRPSADALSTPA